MNHSIEVRCGRATGSFAYPLAVIPPEETCSFRSRAAGESLVGSTPEAMAWLLLEIGGRWGRDAILESRLDRRVTEELQRAALAAGVRLLALRRPRSPSGLGRVIAVNTSDRGPFAVELPPGTAEDLLDIDLAALVAGVRPGGQTIRDSFLAVCVHGTRDQCCAVHGVRLERAFRGVAPDRVWGCSHTGGHRFAPNAVLFPQGMMFGRIDLATAASACRRLLASEIDLAAYRGRSTYSPPIQAAEAAVRADLGLRHADSLRLERSQVRADGMAATATFAGPDHETTVVVHGVPAPPRLASCGQTKVEHPVSWSARCRD